jgi:hypothetical protein
MSAGDSYANAASASWPFAWPLKAGNDAAKFLMRLTELRR